METEMTIARSTNKLLLLVLVDGVRLTQCHWMAKVLRAGDTSIHDG